MCIRHRRADKRTCRTSEQMKDSSAGYGRMERDSRFYLLNVVLFRITRLKAVSYFDQEEILKKVYEE